MIGVLSDAHGNIGAFRLAISNLERMGATRFYFLGDAVGYIPSIEVVQELISLGDRVICVRGNHEEMVLNRIVSQTSESVYQHQMVIDQLTENLTSFIKSWPVQSMEEFNGARTLFVHGGPHDHTNQYIYPDTDLEPFSLSEQFVFMGHTHYPFMRSVGKTVFVNIGSCGLPRDDGRYGAAALYNPHEQSVQLIRFEIDQETNMAFQKYGQVHSSVIALSRRRTDQLVGEII